MEPTEAHRARAFELSEMPPRTNSALIAQALADEFAKAFDAGLEAAAQFCERHNDATRAVADRIRVLREKP